jgi:hypothetical protein
LRLLAMKFTMSVNHCPCEPLVAEVRSPDEFSVPNSPR